MTTEQQREAIKKVKDDFKLKELRPNTFNEVINELGYLQICRYCRKLGDSERTYLWNDDWNANVLKKQWKNPDNKKWVIYDITHKGNSARKAENVGHCLIEVIDCNVLTKEEFDELYEICKSIALSNDILYEKIKNAILDIITKDQTNFNSWCQIASGFKDRIGLEIWQGDLNPEAVSEKI